MRLLVPVPQRVRGVCKVQMERLDGPPRGERRKRPIAATHHRYGSPTPQNGVEVERKWARPDYDLPVLQRPPMYSALKYEGQRLYDLARAGVEVERAEREVLVHQLALTEWSPPQVSVEVRCGRGFYMRTFAHDLGIALGCYANLSKLARTQAGPFTLDDAIRPEEVEDSAETENGWRSLLLPPDAALTKLESVRIDEAAERHLRNGQPVTVAGASVYVRHLETRRAYSAEGRFLGIVRFNRPDGQWQPEKVFSLPDPSPYAPD